MKEPTTAIGRLIREARITAGMTQTDLALSAELSKDTISMYEKGAKIPRTDVFLRILQATGLSWSDIGQIDSRVNKKSHFIWDIPQESYQIDMPDSWYERERGIVCEYVNQLSKYDLLLVMRIVKALVDTPEEEVSAPHDEADA